MTFASCEFVVSGKPHIEQHDLAKHLEDASTLFCDHTVSTQQQ